MSERKLPELAFAPEFVPKILDGTKKHTIRRQKPTDKYPKFMRDLSYDEWTKYLDDCPKVRLTTPNGVLISARDFMYAQIKLTPHNVLFFDTEQDDIKDETYVIASTYTYVHIVRNTLYRMKDASGAMLPKHEIFARNEGFDNWEAFIAWIENHYGLSGDWEQPFWIIFFL